MIPFSFPVMIPAILLTWCIFASYIHVLISFDKRTILFTTKCKVWKHKMGSEGKENQETIHLFSWIEEYANSKTPPDKTKQPENSLQLDTRGGRQGFLEQTPGNSLDSQWGPGYPRVSMELDPGRLWDMQHLNSERHWESFRTSVKSPLNPLARKSEVKRKGGVILISSLSLALIF